MKMVIEYCQALEIAPPKFGKMPKGSHLFAKFDPMSKTIYLPDKIPVSTIEHEVAHYLVFFLVSLEVASRRLNEEIAESCMGRLFKD